MKDEVFIFVKKSMDVLLLRGKHSESCICSCLCYLRFSFYFLVILFACNVFVCASIVNLAFISRNTTEHISSSIFLFL
jgi:hypothetical protein